MNVKKIFAFGILFIAACTPTAPLTSARWTGDGPKPQVDIGTSTLQAEPSWKSSGEGVQIFQQRIGNFRVVGSYLKIVSRKDGSPIFQNLALAPQVNLPKASKATQMNLNKERSWQKFLITHPEFKDQKILKTVEVIFLTEPKLRPALEVVTEKKNGEVYSIFFEKNGKLISANRMGSYLADLTETPALAFPLGPKKSELSNIMLSRKIQPEGLTNTFVEMTTEAPSKIIGAQSIEFQPNDERFDQVQAFYFSNLILQWFKEKLSLSGPLKLSIITHIGYPEKTNAAFYFQNQIRLGAGDDVGFSNIPWDPTIVMHETAHAVIDALSHLPFQGEGGSINEGYADLFTTFYLDNPLLAENSYRKGPYKRRVDMPLKLSEKNGGLYHDSAIVSSFFWSMKKQLGTDKTMQLATLVLNRLGPYSDFKDFILTLKEQTEKLPSEEDRNKVIQLAKERELL